MTIATWITLFRLLLIPVFGLLLAYYARGGGDGPGDPFWRIAALWVFLVAAVSDAVDGYVARRFNQQSRLGAFLDPLADKLLGLTALVGLTVTPTEPEWRFPLWFATLILAKDAIILLGCVVIHMQKGHLEVRPNFAGKATTALLLSVIVGALWRPDWLPFFPLLYVTAFFASLAFVLYVRDALKQLAEPITHKISGQSSQE